LLYHWLLHHTDQSFAEVNLSVFFILFLTAAAVLVITFTHTHPTPPLKMDENVVKKAELGFAKCYFQNLDKKSTIVSAVKKPK